MKVSSRNKICKKVKTSVKKSDHGRIKKKKEKPLPISLISKNATGTANWDQLCKILKTDPKSSKMQKSGPEVESSSKQAFPLSRQFSKSDRKDITLTVQKQNGVSRESQTKCVFSGIRDIGNALSPVKTDKMKSGKPKETLLAGPSAYPTPKNRETSIRRATQHVAMDCEMVGTGLNGSDSMIARVSIVNRYGDCLYDVYVKPKDDITDYRTPVSGIRPSDLANGKDLFTVQKEVLAIIEGKILIGHALKNDLDVLFISHPKSMIRDTSKYKPFRAMFDGRTPSLKKLTAKLLQIEIQSGEHSSVEDARAAMQIYLMHKSEWEKSLKYKRKRMEKAIQNTDENVQ